MRKICPIIFLLLLFPLLSFAEEFGIPPECEIIVDDFKDGIKPGWEAKSFKGKTEYTWMRDNEKSYIRATSNNSASGLFYKIEFDPEIYPYIVWNWQVDNTLAKGDATKKSGDDYGARIYIIFPSYLFWNTRAINYIWANKLPRNAAVPNPYTANDFMVSVQSGPQNTGKWHREIRNVYEDYIRFFGRKPGKVGAIAIMTDTDNTGEKASAAYGPIAVCSKVPGR